MKDYAFEFKVSKSTICTIIHFILIVLLMDKNFSLFGFISTKNDDLEDRKKTTIEKVTQLRAGLENLLPLIENKMPNENLVKLDTSNIGEIETSIFIADKMLDGIHDKILCKNKH